MAESRAKEKKEDYVIDYKGTYVCSLCAFKTPKRLKIRAHCNRHYLKNWLQCDSCDKSYLCKKSLIRHIKTHAVCNLCDCVHVHRKKTNEKCTPVDGRYACELCTASYETAHCLINHKGVHVNAEFTCDHCNFPTSDKLVLLKHIIKNHLESSTKVPIPKIHNVITCVACNTTFTRKENYMRHVKNMHLQSKGIKVNYVLSTKDEKTVELVRNTDALVSVTRSETRNTFVIKVIECDEKKRVRNFQLLNERIRNGLGQPKNRVQCPECSYFFARTYLTRHVNQFHRSLKKIPLRSSVTESTDITSESVT